MGAYSTNGGYQTCSFLECNPWEINKHGQSKTTVGVIVGSLQSNVKERALQIFLSLEYNWWDINVKGKLLNIFSVE